MPTFGEFETVGEPIATGEERSHASTVWRAVKPAANDGREYTVKCYAPNQRALSRSFETETLSRDRGLEFLDGIKEQRRAQAAGGRSLAPIYEFGLGDKGAWYVTDYYARGNLKAWITKKGRVDSAGLRHVLSQLVAGCLALRSSRGYSHGNIKVSNAFRAGSKGTFRQTPILLTDPYPAGPARELDMPNTELLGNVMEAEDLRAIGEVLMQLVEGRLLASSEDYNWPIAPSPAWSNLGKDGERWLQLTNQLLDGNRAPATLNLDILAEKYPPSAGSGKSLLALAAAVVAVCVLGGGFFAIKSGSAKRNENQFNADFQAAKLASATNLNLALTKVNAALARKQASKEAGDLRDKILADIDQAFNSAIQSGNSKLTPFTEEALVEAEKFLTAASTLKPTDAAVAELRRQIDGQRGKLNERTALEAKREELTKALADAETAFKAKLWAEAKNAFSRAATLAEEVKDTARESTAREGLKRVDLEVANLSAEEQLANAIAADLSRADDDRKAKLWTESSNSLSSAMEKIAKLSSKQTVQKLQADVGRELSVLKNEWDAWKQQEGKRVAIRGLISAGDAAVATNKVAASNQFAAALADAKKLPDNELAAEASTKLETIIGRLVEEKRTQDALAATEKENRAYQEARDALEACEFANARQKRGVFKGIRFEELDARLKREEPLYRTLTNHLALSRYDEILNVTDLPATRMFAAIKTAADREKKILQDADTQFKAGTTTKAFVFLSSGEFNSLASKPAFSNLVAEARRELDQGQKASGLWSATNLAALKDYLNTEVKSKASKEPFKSYAIRANALEADLKKAEAELAELARQAEAKYAELIKAGEKLLGEGKFAEAKAKGDEALKTPNVRDLSTAKSLVNLADASLAQDVDLKSAQKALGAGDYPTVANLRAKYPKEKEFVEIGTRAEAESTALETYKKNFEAGDYNFISELQSKAEYKAKPHFATLLQNAIGEKALLSSLESSKATNNWSEVLGKLTDATFAAVLTKKPFSDINTWALGQKGAVENERASQILSLDVKLEVLLVQYNVLRANDPKITTPSGRQAKRLTDVANQQKDYDLKVIKWLGDEYRRLGVINDQDRNNQIGKLNKLIPTY